MPLLSICAILHASKIILFFCQTPNNALTQLIVVSFLCHHCTLFYFFANLPALPISALHQNICDILFFASFAYFGHLVSFQQCVPLITKKSFFALYHNITLLVFAHLSFPKTLPSRTATLSASA